MIFRFRATVAIVFVIVYSVFSMSAVSAAGFAGNETAHERAHTEFSNLSEQIMTNVTANQTGMDRKIATAVAKPVSIMSERAALSGLSVGYTLPLAGRAIGASAPVVMIGGLGAYLYYRIKAVKQQ